jgi:glycosyltransferase involved in cell wall biosynthesis
MTRPLRVLVLTNLYPPMVIGGYELARANVARGLARRGHEPRVLTSWSHLLSADTEPVKVHRDLDLHWLFPHISGTSPVVERDLHAALCSSIGNTLQLLRALAEFRPDVVYVWNLLGVGAAGLLDMLNLVGVPWVAHLMDRWPAEIVKNTPPYVLGPFDAQGSSLYRRARMISMSEHLLDEIRAVGGVAFAGVVDLLPGAVDLAETVPHEPYLRDGIARFVTAGSVNENKGIDLILDASRMLASRGIRFTVDVFGEGDLPRYVDRSRSLGVGDRVRFCGPRSQRELLRLYAGYDAFLFPTWCREPFGLAPVEAAGCGTPPIITRVCGAAERLVDGVHCIKIDRSASALTEAMAAVAEGRVDLARMARACRRLANSDLSFDRCLDRVESVLAAHATPWRHESAQDPSLPRLALFKHNLSLRLRFG